MENFSYNLSKIRIAKGISQRDFSILANLRNQRRCEMLESGRGAVTLDEIISICKALNVSIDDMLYKEVKVEFVFE